MSQQVPEISAFLLVTFFPCLPAICYLSFFQEHAYPFDAIAGIIMLLLLAVEFVIGSMAWNKLIVRQTAQFYRLCQEEG